MGFDPATLCLFLCEISFFGYLEIGLVSGGGGAACACVCYKSHCCFLALALCAPYVHFIWTFVSLLCPCSSGPAEVPCPASSASVGPRAGGAWQYCAEDSPGRAVSPGSGAVRLPCRLLLLTCHRSGHSPSQFQLPFPRCPAVLPGGRPVIWGSQVSGV